MLYALSLGYGSDPEREAELRFVYEKDLTVHPGFPLVIARFEQWTNRSELELDWRRVLHAEQALAVHRPIVADADYRAEYAITGIKDRGEGRGAMIQIEKTVFQDGENRPCATSTMGWLLAGDGGCGASDDLAELAGTPLPDRAADHSCDTPVPEQAALLYRLNGDYNPLHADPEFARGIGFDKPILHGLATYGLAWRAIAHVVADDDATGITYMGARFSKPFFPGETLRTEVYEGVGGAKHFRCLSVERDVVVLDRGIVRMRGEAGQ